MKTIILTMNFGNNTPTWAINAKCKQLKTWVDQNKENLPFQDLIIFPDTSGETKLYWLDGEANNEDHKKKLSELKNRLTPIISATVDIQTNKSDPDYKKAMEEFKQLRELKMRRK
jgi:hypothetical protein